MLHQRSDVPERVVSLAHLSLLDLAAPDLVDVAAEAGFDAVGLRISPAGADDHPWPLVGQPASLRRLRDRLDATGVGVLDIEVLRLDRLTRPDSFAGVLDTAVALGATYALVNAYESDPDHLRASFHALCQIALAAGVRPVLEFLPYTGVRTLAQAREVVRGSGGGVLIDPLHLARSGGSARDVGALDASLRPYLQLCDAPLAAPDGGDDGLRVESRHERMALGYGELPLRELLGVYAPSTPVSVEAPSDSARARLGARGWARALHESVERLTRPTSDANGVPTWPGAHTPTVS